MFKGEPHTPLENPLEREALRVRGMQEAVQSEEEPSGPFADPHGRQAV